MCTQKGERVGGHTLVRKMNTYQINMKRERKNEIKKKTTALKRQYEFCREKNTSFKVKKKVRKMTLSFSCLV